MCLFCRQINACLGNSGELTSLNRVRELRIRNLLKSKSWNRRMSPKSKAALLIQKVNPKVKRKRRWKKNWKN